MSIFESFRLSRLEMGKVSTLTTTALLIGLNIVLSYFTIVPNEFIKIGFSSLPIAIIGMLYGPFVAGAANGVGDLLRYLLHPTGPYFPGFTFDAILTGIFFGLFLYKRKPSWVNVIWTRVVVSLVVNLGFNTLWISVLYGKGLFVILPMRIVKNLVMFPIEVVMLYTVVVFSAKIFKDKLKQ